MKPLTKDQQIENLLVAQAMFQDIPAQRISLDWWSNAVLRTAVSEGKDPVHSCGSTACFGGWVALHPHFQRQGVRGDNYCGSPEMAGVTYPEQVALHLFGNDMMFAERHWASGELTSDRQEVFARIKYALKQLTAD
jgi:hypothetical protein